MRTIIFMTIFLVCNFAQAQQSSLSEDTAKIKLYELKTPATYKFNGQEFSFTPESDIIKITKIEKNKEEQNFGQLRKTTDDGLYIMTSTMSDEVSFGRFDSVGNFRSLRYDSKSDSVLEEFYEMTRTGTQLSSTK